MMWAVTSCVWEAWLASEFYLAPVSRVRALSQALYETGVAAEPSRAPKKPRRTVQDDGE